MAEERKINLVLNRLSQSKYDELKQSHQLCADQLYLINDTKLDAANQVIENVATPVQTDDAANKDYVDHAVRSMIADKVLYDLVTKEWQLSAIEYNGTQISAEVCYMDSYAINTVQISSDQYPYFMYMPNRISGKARDFAVRVEVLSAFQTYPTVCFLGRNESCDFECENEDWAQIEAGVNLFNFTETKAQET